MWFGPFHKGTPHGSNLHSSSCRVLSCTGPATQAWAGEWWMLGPASIFTNVICGEEDGETIPASPGAAMPFVLFCQIQPLGGEVGFAGGPQCPGVAANRLLAGAGDASAALLGPGARINACPVGRRGCPVGVVHGLWHLAGHKDFVLRCSVLRAASSAIRGAFLSGGGPAKVSGCKTGNRLPLRVFGCSRFLAAEVVLKPGPVPLPPPASGTPAAVSLHAWHHTRFCISGFFRLYSIIKREKTGFEREKRKQLNSQ